MSGYVINVAAKRDTTVFAKGHVFRTAPDSITDFEKAAEIVVNLRMAFHPDSFEITITHVQTIGKVVYP